MDKLWKAYDRYGNRIYMTTERWDLRWRNVPGWPSFSMTRGILSDTAVANKTR